MIYFVGDCTFKTALPDNVIKSGVGKFIKRFRIPVLSTEDVYRVVQTIEKHLSESILSNKDHIKSLRKRHSSNTICPSCGSNLIEKQLREGLKRARSF